MSILVAFFLALFLTMPFPYSLTAEASQDGTDGRDPLMRTQDVEREQRPVRVDEPEAQPIRSLQSEERRVFEERVRQQLDEQRQRVALRIADMLYRSNISLATQYQQYLDRMERVLEKMRTRAQAFEAQGSDIDLTLAAIAVAQDVITDVRSHIQVQLDKEYVPVITDAQPAGPAIRDTVRQLRTDHQQLRDTQLSRVRTAMQEAFLTLREAAPVVEEQQAPPVTQNPDTPVATVAPTPETQAQPPITY
jgi:hypothetical protein